MTCDDSLNITFEFVTDDGKTFMELRPRSMQFDRTRGKFDYCQAEFSQEVADHLRGILNRDETILKRILPVYVSVGGDKIYRLIYTPDGVVFGENAVHIEFQDPQKSLTQGTVDIRNPNMKLKEAYREVFNQRNKSGPKIFNEIKFSIPDKVYEDLRIGYDENLFNFDISDKGNINISDEAYNKVTNNGELKGREILDNIETRRLYELFEGHTSVDFDRITPWEAINRLNDMFNIRTWAAPDGNLWVGERQATGYGHIAAPDDERVAKLSDYNVTEVRDPVVRSVVRGGWADDPSESGFNDLFWELESLNRGTDEFRVEGVSEIPTENIFGQVITDEADVKRDVLKPLAEQKLKDKQREQQSGHLDILPEQSGDEFSKIEHVQVGDSILTVPPDSDSNGSSVCKTNIEKEIFDIVGVQHELTDDGQWNIRLDVMKKLDGELDPENIDTNLRYYDPSAKEYIEGNEYEDMESVGFWPDF